MNEFVRKQGSKIAGIRNICAFVGILSALLASSGCTSYHRDSGADYLERPLSAGSVPYYTDFQVSSSRKVATGEASVLFWVFQLSDGKYCELERNPRLSILSRFFDFFSPAQKAVSNAKGSALYNLCEKNQADQVLGATFEYKIVDYLFFCTVECTAKGYPAMVKGIKMQEKQPVILNEWQKIEYLAPHETPMVYSGPEDAVPPLRPEK